MQFYRATDAGSSILRDFVESDFAEVPSILFEEWAHDPAVLSSFARNPETDEPMPSDLLRRVQASDSLGRASKYLFQVALGSASLELHDRDPRTGELGTAFREAFDQYYPQPFGSDEHFWDAMNHLTTYSALYYTFVWCAVIARDLLQPFRERGSLVDRELADRYAREILEPGASRPARDLIRAYLGRDFQFDAFERWIQESALRGEVTPSLTYSLSATRHQESGPVHHAE